MEVSVAEKEKPDSLMIGDAVSLLRDYRYGYV